MSIASEEFAILVAPYRPELLVHCYRMLGSARDAEDVVQGTYLRAWRSFGDFEGRSKLRLWLYRIAANAALRELEKGRAPRAHARTWRDRADSRVRPVHGMRTGRSSDDHRRWGICSRHRQVTSPAVSFPGRWDQYR